jgi:hypothetical protein
MESFVKYCTATAWYQREVFLPFGALPVQKICPTTASKMDVRIPKITKTSYFCIEVASTLVGFIDFRIDWLSRASREEDGVTRPQRAPAAVAVS